MASQVIRRLLAVAGSREIIAAVNSLVDMVNGNRPGRIKLRGDDGEAKTTRGGAVSSANYALDVQAASGYHGVFTHSTGSPVILAVTDSGNVTANAINSGNLGVTGNLTFLGTARRILADLTNATVANRLLFQTSTANSATCVSAIPSGSGVIAYLSVFNNATPASASVEGMLRVNGTATQLRSESPSGSYKPLEFHTNATLNAQLSTAGVLSAPVLVAGSATGTPAGSETLRSTGAALFDSTVTLPTIDPPTVNGQATEGSQCKAFAYVTAGGGATLGTNYNVASVTRNVAGDFTIAWDRDFANATYALIVTVEDNALTLISKVNSQAAGSADVYFLTTAGTKTDPDAFSVIAFGTLN